MFCSLASRNPRLIPFFLYIYVVLQQRKGKTAVAEYAIAKALNNGQRVIYTSPIKVRDECVHSDNNVSISYVA
tara:strand:- start:212 stop:430 length:219 start_codon:yes stop_codon:yes gene_type:complete